MGAQVNIVTIPGYLPMVNNDSMSEMFKANATSLVGEDGVVSHPADGNRGSSTDMGDLSQVIPVIR